MAEYLKLNEIDCYKNSFELSNYIWKIVSEWDSLAKYSIGRQFIDAVDSVSANIVHPVRSAKR